MPHILRRNYLLIVMGVIATSAIIQFVIEPNFWLAAIAIPATIGAIIAARMGRRSTLIALAAVLLLPTIAAIAVPSSASAASLPPPPPGQRAPSVTCGYSVFSLVFSTGGLLGFAATDQWWGVSAAGSTMLGAWGGVYDTCIDADPYYVAPAWVYCGWYGWDCWGGGGVW